MELKPQDIILEVLTTQRYSDIEARLRGAGFAHDTRQGAPMCRCTLRGLLRKKLEAIVGLLA